MNSDSLHTAKEGAVKRALIADDEPTLVKFAETLLRREGFEVQSVGDGTEVLPAVIDFQPHLLVLDILMPHLNGFEVLRELHSNPKCGGVRILVCSALTERDYILRAFEEGADDYLAKPFEPEDFLLRALKLTHSYSHPHTSMTPAEGSGDDVTHWVRTLIHFYRQVVESVDRRGKTGKGNEEPFQVLVKLEELLDNAAAAFEHEELDEERLMATLAGLRNLIESSQQKLK